MQDHGKLVLVVSVAEVPLAMQHVPGLMASVVKRKAPLIAEVGMGANLNEAPYRLRVTLSSATDRLCNVQQRTTSGWGFPANVTHKSLVFDDSGAAPAEAIKQKSGLSRRFGKIAEDRQ